ncbi:MAG TPA: carbohydrate binding domain-containing protein, partial [Oligoflexia bacterium]|nr:carbohydrate binding domain-containing protein [Oligoflexia bacterium]
ADFETPEQALLWAPIHYGNGFTEIRISSRQAADGRSSLAITGGGGTWRGAEYDAGERDWSKYGQLVLRAYNPHAHPLVLSLRIDDMRKDPSYTERFNKSITLTSHWNEIRIPMAEIFAGPHDGKLDLEHVKRLLFILPKDPAQLTIFVDRIELS